MIAKVLKLGQFDQIGGLLFCMMWYFRTMLNENLIGQRPKK